MARSDPDDTIGIQIDKQDLYQIAKCVQSDAYNPYVHAEGLRNQI